MKIQYIVLLRDLPSLDWEYKLFVNKMLTVAISSLTAVKKSCRQKHG